MDEVRAIAASRKIRCGRCRLCQKFGRLTKEHVPPASAFNKGSYRQYYIDQSEQANLNQWRSRDVNSNGIFVFSLCERCNQKTGRAYASAYASFVQPFADLATYENAGTEIEVEFKKFSPIRVVKQVVSMILSTSNPESFNEYQATWNPFLSTEESLPSVDLFGQRPSLERLREIYDALRFFVDKRDAKGLPPTVRLYTYSTANPGSGVMTDLLASGNLSTGQVFWGAVVGLWPIHWLLTVEGEPDMQLLEVTDWANGGYKDKRTIAVRMPCHWTYAKYPLDFRTPDKFLRDGFVSRMRLEGYIPAPGEGEDPMLEGALQFARKRGTITTEGFFLKQFRHGTYAEYQGTPVWFEGRRLREVREALRERLKREREQEVVNRKNAPQV
jgi:hypothetical protein